MKRLGLPVVLCLGLSATAGAGDVATLQSSVAAIAKREGGTVGIGLLHVPSGETVFVNGTERFPMFSVYKLPIAMTLLQRVDEGTARLDEAVELGPADMRPSVSTAVSSRVRNGRVTMTVAELVQAAVSASDNTASDTILRRAGGPEAVTAFVRNLGVAELRVDRQELEMGADLAGATPAQKRAAERKYLHDDPRDTTTPEAAVALLRRVQERDALGPQTASFLVAALEATTTGDRRIRGLLPPGTVVADKTGSGPRTTNDVGWMTLPNGKGHVLVAVFVRDSPRADTLRERTIARIARAAYDHWSR